MHASDVASLVSPQVFSMHILILTDREWTNPQGGGTGTNLYCQVSRWLAWGHRVTVIACGYPGAPAHERIGELTIHRIGGRSTLFPRAIRAQLRGGDAARAPPDVPASR